MATTITPIPHSSLQYDPALSYQVAGSVFPPLESRWASDHFDQESIQKRCYMPSESVIKGNAALPYRWNTCPWSPEPPCKKSNFSETAMLERPHMGTPVNSLSRTQSSSHHRGTDIWVKLPWAFQISPRSTEYHLWIHPVMSAEAILSRRIVQLSLIQIPIPQNQKI